MENKQYKYRAYKPRRSVLRQFWAKDYAPWVIVALVGFVVYVIVCSKLMNYVVGGL